MANVHLLADYLLASLVLFYAIVGSAWRLLTRLVNTIGDLKILFVEQRSVALASKTDNGYCSSGPWENEVHIRRFMLSKRKPKLKHVMCIPITLHGTTESEQAWLKASTCARLRYIPANYQIAAGTATKNWSLTPLILYFEHLSMALMTAEDTSFVYIQTCKFIYENSLSDVRNLSSLISVSPSAESGSCLCDLFFLLQLNQRRIYYIMYKHDY